MRIQNSPEAFIGICYVVASAAAIVLLSKSSVESELLKEMLIGNILTVSLTEVGLTTLWYLLLGGLLFIFHKKFLKPHLTQTWDFIFYALFGMVVTSSVKIAGVFLVFSFLIVPSVCAVLLAKSMKKRLQVGWMIGALASFLGIVASAVFDLPTGAAIVVAFGFIFAVIILQKSWQSTANK
jgi:zinc/manganese transport system permease protein